MKRAIVFACGLPFLATVLADELPMHKLSGVISDEPLPDPGLATALPPGHCLTTSACQELKGDMYVCNELSHCQHKALLGTPGFNHWDVATSLSIFVLFTFTAAAGTGGGGVLVPLFIALEVFSAKDAVAISQATIFGGAIANMVWNVQQRHPHCDRPLINLELGLVMEPMTMAGTVIGVLLNRVLPSWILLLLLVIILSVTFFRTWENAIKKQASERKKEALVQSLQEGSTTLYAEDAYDAVSSIADYQQLNARPARLREGDVSLPELLEQDSQLRPEYLLVYVGCWVLILALSVIKGGTDGEESIAGVMCGTPWFWVLNLSVLPIMVAIQYPICKYFMARDANKERVGYRFIENDIRWDSRMTTWLPTASYFIGMFAGMLGIGGGLFKAPLLNELGIDPLVTGATCAFMILFTSSISTAQYIIFDVLQLDYAIWFGLVGFTSSMLGQYLNSVVIKRMHGKTSHLVFIVAGVVGASAIFLLIQGALTISRGTSGMSSLCSLEEIPM